jgi:hypothetical protein
MVFLPDRIKVFMKGCESTLDWDLIEGVRERRGYFFMKTKMMESHALPKRTFSRESEEQFRDLLCSKAGSLRLNLKGAKKIVI